MFQELGYTYWTAIGGEKWRQKGGTHIIYIIYNMPFTNWMSHQGWPRGVTGSQKIVEFFYVFLYKKNYV